MYQMQNKTKPDIYAFSQTISISADKARRVIDLIRGYSYEETLILLELLPYRAAYPIFKLVYSAASNASSTFTSKKENLFISKAEVNERPAVKKLKPRARGRSYPIRRAACHITIVLADLSLDLTESLEPKQAKNPLAKLYLNLRGVWDKK
uniref:ribosomal protein L22 n=1 Tax=Cuscuta corymbosa var. stylosa TaxID=437254 RepID=UPI002434FB01|nr:ribosomal protein L22 [Cuscuta corymbosa var. stylosa]WEY29961.1 ribosomal protein L22 [Cuscuta corymbosa var. stylosa]